MRESHERVAPSRIRGRRAWVCGFVGLSLALAAGAGVATRFQRPDRIDGPEGSIAIVAQVRTGHQRAERLTFADDGRLLAVICPRYNRLVLYRVDTGSRPALTLSQDIPLEGRPVALAATADRLIVLQRPTGDARHTRKAFWDPYDFEGRRIGSRFDVGTDSDDLAVSADGATALVLLSGCAEGEVGRPSPSLRVIDISDPDQPCPRGEVSFDHPRDDPKSLCQERLGAAVLLGGSNQAALLDVRDREHPRIIERVDIPAGSEPDRIGFDLDGGISAAGWEQSQLRPLRSNLDRVPLDGGQKQAALIGPILSLRSNHDAAERRRVSVAPGVVQFRRGSRVFGTISLGGLGGIRITDMVWFPTDRASGMLALCDRSGGVHLLAVRVKVP